ncbi:hypothetical protein GCM10007242_44400 [Pigmentiphaga litoralis]|nr:hypothetical protein GCM10007242_44400 [Pigmentiphaga litoralis]
MQKLIGNQTEMVIAPIDFIDRQAMRDARNGGVLRYEGGLVSAFAARRRIGFVDSSEVHLHLMQGGRAYYRPANDLVPPSVVCTLLA